MQTNIFFSSLDWTGKNFQIAFCSPLAKQAGFKTSWSILNCPPQSKASGFFVFIEFRPLFQQSVIDSSDFNVSRKCPPQAKGFAIAKKCFFLLWHFAVPVANSSHVFCSGVQRCSIKILLLWTMNIVLENAYGCLMIGFLSKVSMSNAAFQSYLNFNSLNPK